jgi:hypothetical protein
VLDFRRPGAAHAHLQTERLAALAAWADPLLISLLSMAAPKLPRVFRPRRRRRLISAASDRRRTSRARGLRLPGSGKDPGQTFMILAF